MFALIIIASIVSVLSMRSERSDLTMDDIPLHDVFANMKLDDDDSVSFRQASRRVQHQIFPELNADSAARQNLKRRRGTFERESPINIGFR